MDEAAATQATADSPEFRRVLEEMLQPLKRSSAASEKASRDAKSASEATAGMAADAANKAGQALNAVEGLRQDFEDFKAQVEEDIEVLEGRPVIDPDTNIIQVVQPDQVETSSWTWVAMLGLGLLGAFLAQKAWNNPRTDQVQWAIWGLAFFVGSGAAWLAMTSGRVPGLSKQQGQPPKA